MNKAAEDAYRKQVTEFDYDYRSVDWRSPESQRCRFDVLLGVGTMHWGDTLADVGCGVGHFYEYLLYERRMVLQGRVEYYGFDLLIEMLSVARRKFPVPAKDNRFCKLDILTQPLPQQFDWILANGLFGLGWMEQTVKVALSRMFHSMKRGMAVNFPSIYNADNMENGFYAEPAGMLSWVQENLTEHVVLRHDYMPHDFTLYLYPPYKK